MGLSYFLHWPYLPFIILYRDTHITQKFFKHLDKFLTAIHDTLNALRSVPSTNCTMIAKSTPCPPWHRDKILLNKPGPIAGALRRPTPTNYTTGPLYANFRHNFNPGHHKDTDSSILDKWFQRVLLKF